tara:strand:- start:87 stop:452 length:366 start_codon:yes stop_codon:yes gene_type:complete
MKNLKIIKDLRLFDKMYFVFETEKIQEVDVQGVNTNHIFVKVNHNKIRIPFAEEDLTSFVLFGEYDIKKMYFTEPEKALREREKNIKKQIANNNIAIKLLLDKGQKLSNRLVESLKYQLEN